MAESVLRCVPCVAWISWRGIDDHMDLIERKAVTAPAFVPAYAALAGLPLRDLL